MRIASARDLGLVVRQARQDRGQTQAGVENQGSSPPQLPNNAWRCRKCGVSRLALCLTATGASVPETAESAR